VIGIAIGFCAALVSALHLVTQTDAFGSCGNAGDRKGDLLIAGAEPDNEDEYDHDLFSKIGANPRDAKKSFNDLSESSANGMSFCMCFSSWETHYHTAAQCQVG
jgi:hypothetical protein